MSLKSDRPEPWTQIHLLNWLGVLGQPQALRAPVAIRVEVQMIRTIALEVEAVCRCGEELEGVEEGPELGQRDGTFPAWASPSYSEVPSGP